MPRFARPGSGSASRARTTPRAGKPSWKRERRFSKEADMRFFSTCCGVLFEATASAQGSFPSKPVTMVVGFEPGGGTDTVARIVAKTMGENLGQQVVVENRAGAGGNIAVDYVAKSAPDGYTVVLANVGALAVNPHLIKVPYDPLRDLTPLTMAVVFANVLVVQPSLAVSSLADYVKLAREKPATVTYASSGIGGAGHLAGELLKMMAQIDIVHVDRKSTRLNSSHGYISYAVFCLKKKKTHP